MSLGKVVHSGISNISVICLELEVVKKATFGKGIIKCKGKTNSFAICSESCFYNVFNLDFLMC